MSLCIEIVSILGFSCVRPNGTVIKNLVSEKPRLSSLLGYFSLQIFLRVSKPGFSHL